MDQIEALFSVDWKSVIIAIFIALFSFQITIRLFQWLLFDFFGIETKAMRQRKEEHRLLLQTANDLKELSMQHKEDVRKSIEHDQKIQNNLDNCMTEIKMSLEETQVAIRKFTENRIHDREQSFAIQKELTESMTKISDSNNIRDEQLNDIVWSQKESLADRINQKYKHYLSI